MNSKGNRACRGTTKAGSPCNGIPTTGSLYCPFHDPERVVERLEWSRRGGKASSTQKRLSRLIQDAEELRTADVLQLLSGGMLLLMEGKRLWTGVVLILAAAVLQTFAAGSWSLVLGSFGPEGKRT